MPIKQEDIHRLCELSGLKSDDASLSLVQELNEIMDFVEQLQNQDTANVSPMYHPFDLHQPLRQDEVTEKSCLKELTELAPLFEKEVYWVPQVVDKDHA